MELLTPINTWEDEFLALKDDFLGDLARCEVIDAAAAYVQGLLMPLANKNGWTIAEATGSADPQAHQRLLRTAVWDEEALRDQRQHTIIENFADSEGIFIVDETGFLKSGSDSVGVARQYTGTAGKVENSQVAVFTAYVGSGVRVLWDKRLYMPARWFEDPERLEKAGVPADLELQTKPEQAWQQYVEAKKKGLPIAWVTGDTVYGQNPQLRANLIGVGQKFVMAVPVKTKVYPERPLKYYRAKPGKNRRRRQFPRLSVKTLRVDELVAQMPENAFTRIVVGPGSKGPRTHMWASRRVAVEDSQGVMSDLWLLVRRSCTDPTDIAYYLAWAPARTPLHVLAKVASTRWNIEECFAEAKSQVGLADYQVRKWTPWHRHIELAMLAHLILVILKHRHGDLGQDLGDVSVAETRRLLEIAMPPPPRCSIAQYCWSIWRRKHNRKARDSHYRSRQRRALTQK